MRFLRFIIFSSVLIIISAAILSYFGQKQIIIVNKVNIEDLSSSGGKAFYSGALSQVGIVKTYDLTNGYYPDGGYPPKDTGVCSDVLWRAFLKMNIDFKKLIDEDMKSNLNKYPNKFDSNINFRRVKNINTFLSSNSKTLNNDMNSGDQTNLKDWQTGDIVVFDELFPKRLWHVGIITDKRREDGVPYMIDNHGYGVDIRITPLDWPTKIIGHYRYF